MRRAACILVLGAAMLAPASASAQTLSLASAAAAAQRYADALSAQTWLTQDRGAQVTGCRRVTARVVDCSFFTLVHGEPPTSDTFRCDDAVRVYLPNPRSYATRTQPIGTPSCYEV